MVQANRLHDASFVEMARRGNLRAIASWLNQALFPYGFRVAVGSPRVGHLKLLVDLKYPDIDETDDWREQLIRFICHRLWQLNSPFIDGVSIVTRFVDQPRSILWKQSVRIVTPANQRRRRQAKQQAHQHQHLRSRIRQTSRRKQQLRRNRALLVGGPAIAAIMVGGFFGYTKAPISQTDAAASSQAKNNKNSLPARSDTVQTALETIPVVKHNQVANPDDPTVTLMFSGDVTLADHFEQIVGKDYQRSFAAMDEYRKADLAMVNLENPLTRATIPMPDKQFNFKSDPESVKVLTEGGVDIVNVANNHTMDFEADGLKETLDTLNTAGIQYVGAGKDLTEARRPKIIDVKGQRLAYLSYWGEEYGAEANKAGVNSIQETRIAEDIRAIREQVDWVIVNFHWGQELADYPADWQMQLGRFTVDQGADVVVGHHPHVLQGAEIYRGRPIAYSLGNFIFGGNSRTDYDTAVLKVALKDKQMKVEFLPVEVKGYQPKVVTGDRGQEILNHVNHLSSEFKQPMQPSVVLDARTFPPAPPESRTTPADSSETTTPPAPSNEANPSTTSPSANPSVPTGPAGGNSAPNLEPIPGGQPEPTPDGLAPVPLPSDAPPDANSGQSAPPPAPIDPANVDLLPGYGEINPPAPNPNLPVVPPPTGPVNDYSPGLSTPLDSAPMPLPSNEPFITPSVPQDPTMPGGPQLPPLPDAGLDSPLPNTTPDPSFKINQALPQAPESKQTSEIAPTDPPSQSISFRIQPDSQPNPHWEGQDLEDQGAKDQGAKDQVHLKNVSPTDEGFDPTISHNVALAGPMMW